MPDAPRPVPLTLDSPALIDTSVWSWVRDRRFPHLADWFNTSVSQGHVQTCDLVVIELSRAVANADQVTLLRARLQPIEHVAMSESIWDLAAQLQLDLAATGDHQRVPPTDLLIAATAIAHDLQLVHYDRDYERIARVSELRHRWFVPDGSLAA